ncbi:MAG: prepilin-type N-terminal cleavage/methylation domain-containing protein [Polyangiales bacterium]
MRARQAGFTLIELMIVVSIMGTMAALLAPGIGEMLADGRAAAASEDMVGLIRHVRARAQETGLAHLILFGSTSNDSNGLGRLRVYEGMNNHCRQTPWPQTVSGAVANGHTTVDAVDLGSANYNPPTSGRAATKDDQNRQVIRLQAFDVAGNTIETLALCYEPSGATWEGQSATSDIGYAFTRMVQPITFTVTRKVNTESRGLTRQVVFQPGGIARFKF